MRHFLLIFFAEDAVKVYLPSQKDLKDTGALNTHAPWVFATNFKLKEIIKNIFTLSARLAVVYLVQNSFHGLLLC